MVGCLAIIFMTVFLTGILFIYKMFRQKSKMQKGNVRPELPVTSQETARLKVFGKLQNNLQREQV
jgi:hypothetical protein